MNITLEKAIEEIDRVISQTNGAREYHLFMAACINTIRAAIATTEQPSE